MPSPYDLQHVLDQPLCSMLQLGLTCSVLYVCVLFVWYSVTWGSVTFWWQSYACNWSTFCTCTRSGSSYNVIHSSSLFTTVTQYLTAPLTLVVPSADTEWDHCRDAYHCALHLSPGSPCGGSGCDWLSWSRWWSEGGPGPCDLSLCSGTDVYLCSRLQVRSLKMFLKF